jgi:hypothetical protein
MSENKEIPVFNFKKSIRYVPFHDGHYGSPTFDLKSALQVINYIKNNDNVYTSIDGDCIENITPDCVALPIDQVMTPTQQINGLLALLEPIKHRILFTIDGNHINRTRKRAYLDVMSLISDRLGVPYLGIGGYVKFVVGKQIYTIALQHGAMGSVNWENEIKRLRTVYPEAEVFLLGHDHNLTLEYKPYISIDNKTGKEIHKYHIFGRTGNFIGYPEYARERLYEMKMVGSLNLKFHSDIHYVTGYKMMFLNGVQIHENLNNAGRRLEA